MSAAAVCPAQVLTLGLDELEELHQALSAKVQGGQATAPAIIAWGAVNSALVDAREARLRRVYAQMREDEEL